ncbi:hypothetical protein ACJ72_02606 [Emergomyces africanus]|uniref:Uncharacterized protein n=1 Tax=Emergomyces africanus TaxID=1955775 RepID=A0A1B7P201_9EURO|nr:hypothetical protein ACJ72_02606 [Emergomyces africanus]
MVQWGLEEYVNFSYLYKQDEADYNNKGGACVYQNARDWAKEQRDEFVKSANERHTQARLKLLPTFKREAISEPTIVLEDYDTSVMFDEAEFHDAAQWSFTHTNDSVEDPQTSTKRKY